MKRYIKLILSKAPLDLYKAIRQRIGSLGSSDEINSLDYSSYIVASEGARWGNILYFLLQSDITGKKVMLGTKNKRAYWLASFPDFAKQILYVPEKALPRPSNYHQFLGEDYSYDQLRSFVTKHFLHNPHFVRFRENYAYAKALHINIRRGDFYSTENSALVYGFDIISFVRHCFENQVIPIQDSIVVISDDIGWCRVNLSFIASFASEVTFLDTNPTEAFFALATAKNLLISNSTFTFWAAYISSFLHGEEGQIYAPNFVCRVPGYEDNKQFLPEWKVVDDFDCNSKAYLLQLIAKTYQ